MAARTSRPGRQPRYGPRIFVLRIRADVRLTSSEGFTKRFETWEGVAAWLTSPDFLKGSAAVSSVRLVHQAAQEDAARRPAVTGPGAAT
jgi:hypothetical protein